eukprot:2503358-Prymnesium_polylepis.1
MHSRSCLVLLGSDQNPGEQPCLQSMIVRCRAAFYVRCCVVVAGHAGTAWIGVGSVRCRDQE